MKTSIYPLDLSLFRHFIIDKIFCFKVRNSSTHYLRITQLFIADFKMNAHILTYIHMLFVTHSSNAKALALNFWNTLRNITRMYYILSILRLILHGPTLLSPCITLRPNLSPTRLTAYIARFQNDYLSL